MTDIFISYAREDAERIQSIVSALEEQGFSVFWDRRIPAGQTWRSYIGKALEEARCLIVAWSRDSVNSSWVMEEADEGKRRGVLVPVLLDPVQQPHGFREIQAADLADWQPGQPSTQFNLFLEDVRAILRARTRQIETDIAPKPKPPYRVSSLFSRLSRYGLAAVIVLLVVVVGYWGIQKLTPLKPTIEKKATPPPRETAEEKKSIKSYVEVPPPPQTKVLVYRAGPYHLGDEDLSLHGWAAKYGHCFKVDFEVDLPIQKLELRLETFGVENSSISLNKHNVGSLPDQPKMPGQKRPNYWSKEVLIPLPIDYLNRGTSSNNNLKVCAELVSDPQFEGDKDDFQIRNIKIIAIK